MYVVLCLLLFERINNIKNCITKLGYLVQGGAALAVPEADAQRQNWNFVSSNPGRWRACPFPLTDVIYFFYYYFFNIVK